MSLKPLNKGAGSGDVVDAMPGSNPSRPTIQAGQQGSGDPRPAGGRRYGHAVATHVTGAASSDNVTSGQTPHRRRRRNGLSGRVRIDIEYPVAGGIYRDKSDESFVVLNVTGNEMLLEYANGRVISIDISYWPLLHPQPALF